VCIVSTDPGSDRPLQGNLSRFVAEHRTDLASFWSFTHHLNRLYAQLHGYRFRRPQLDDKVVQDWLADDGLSPARRIQWSIVKVVMRELEDPSCQYVVWLDSDAYIASSEPLEVVLSAHGLLNTTSSPSQRHFLFAAAAAHQRVGGQQWPKLNISDHFMIVRNTPIARHLMRLWWDFPVSRPSLFRFREELFLEQTVMNEFFPKKHSRFMAPVPPLQLYEGFSGRFVRHFGGIKDQAFQLLLRDALLDRLLVPLRHPKSPWAAVVSEDPVASKLLRLAKAKRWHLRPAGE
ncbi:unnamed protein product, partial [Polarella glacialis]